MARISVRTNEAQVRRALANLDRVGKRATKDALNRTIKGARTQAVKQVRQDINIKARDARKAMSVHRATARNGEAVINISGKPAPLSRFAARQTKRGVTFQVKRSGGRSRLRHGFVARLRSGRVGVFERRKEGGRRAGRLPIDQKFSLSIAKYFDDQSVIAKLGEFIRQRYTRELRHQIDFRIQNVGRRRARRPQR